MLHDQVKSSFNYKKIYKSKCYSLVFLWKERLKNKTSWKNISYKQQYFQSLKIKKKMLSSLYDGKFNLKFKTIVASLIVTFTHKKKDHENNSKNIKQIKEQKLNFDHFFSWFVDMTDIKCWFFSPSSFRVVRQLGWNQLSRLCKYKMKGGVGGRRKRERKDLWQCSKLLRFIRDSSWDVCRYQTLKWCKFKMCPTLKKRPKTITITLTCMKTSSRFLVKYFKLYNLPMNISFSDMHKTSKEGKGSRFTRLILTGSSNIFRARDMCGCWVVDCDSHVDRRGS